MKVRSMFNPTIVRLDPHATLSKAASLMRVGMYGSVAVCEAEQLVGIVTETDIVRAIADRRDPASTPISEYMSRRPLTANPDEDSLEVAERMASHRLRHLPVVERGRLIGMLSARDLLESEARPGRRASATRRPATPTIPPGAYET